MRYPAAAALAFTLAVSFSGLADAAPALSDSETPESRRLYQAGLDYYTAGDRAAALASFREVLRLEPDNRSARAAVRRLEREDAARPAASRPPAERPVRPSIAGALDRFFLVSLPRWYYFERTIGNGLRDVGTLSAQNARVVQLLGEKKVALALNRPFEKDRQLRALLRRASVAAQSLEQA